MSEKVISDYNGYDYKKIFWEDADREYEDQADRMAIRKLLPKRMEVLSRRQLAFRRIGHRIMG